MYLLERGLKTFELRMQRHNQNGQRIAEFLESHPRVDRVYYPGLPNRILSHKIAAKAQMRGFGGLITFTVKNADWKETSRIVDAAKIPRIAPSPGRRRIVNRTAFGDELLPLHAPGTGELRDRGQHDPDVVRN